MSEKEKPPAMPFLVNKDGATAPNWSRLIELLVIVLATLWGNAQMMNYKLEQMQINQDEVMEEIKSIKRDFYRPVFEQEESHK